MATVYWQDAGNHLLTTAGNWSGGSVPSSGDTVIFDVGAAGVTVSGDLSAKEFVNVQFKRTFKSNVGTAGAPVLFGATGDITIDGGGSEIHLGTGGTYAWNQVMLSWLGNGFGNCSLTATGGATLIQLLLGNVSYLAGTTTTMIMSGEPEGRIPGPTLSVGGGTLTTLEQMRGSGYQVATSTITTHRQHAGTFRSDTGTYTNLYQYGGLNLWNNTATMTLLMGLGGQFDASQVARARTITTARGFRGFTYSKNDTVTITNNYLTNYGAKEIAWQGAAIPV